MKRKKNLNISARIKKICEKTKAGRSFKRKPKIPVLIFQKRLKKTSAKKKAATFPTSVQDSNPKLFFLKARLSQAPCPPGTSFRTKPHRTYTPL